ncbi:TrfB-related DNA-binding protein [Chromobacterium vaccinii]|uniref:TrfB-related DNA-binding protein n=1 Tax=Chromobacterium vaccinii TaxID=1108595 RepID=UPI003458EE1D
MAREITPQERIRHLTPEEFEQLRPKLKRLSAGVISVAYSVLVEHKNQATVARETERSRSEVSNICKRVLDKLEDIPAGWVTVEVCVPRHLKETVFQIEQSEREKLKQ